MQEVSEQIDNLASEPVYASRSCALHQVDALGQFDITFFGNELSMKFCGLYSFYKKIKHIDLAELFAAETSPLEIIYLPESDRIFAFDLMQILELREFFAGAFTMLQLNSLIHAETSRKLV